ncbi:RidA family protein [Caulobacter sp. BE254]|uniref:RidA family protein n=1 Tax=Caulobacter sp. BE254 TaxID=2817720 RepID=UPI00286246EA|nr:RidA family protein [Caulobacter sp. BE254]MDR7114809.1 enamine deaminase RidA (YjgF/YER057c/UK114 family) [Caulobacter sp. BE254]
MKTLLIAATILTACTSPALAQDAVIRDNPAGLFTSPRFTNVVEVPAGTALVFVSGLTAQGPDGAAPTDAQGQAQAVFRNLRTALAARGLKPADVIQIRGFLVDIQTTLPAYRQAAGDFFGKAPPPASTVVGVADLVRPDLLLEVELIAARPVQAR